MEFWRRERGWSRDSGELRSDRLSLPGVRIDLEIRPQCLLSIAMGGFASIKGPKRILQDNWSLSYKREKKAGDQGVRGQVEKEGEKVRKHLCFDIAIGEGGVCPITFSPVSSRVTRRS